jgi:hypothetical protein
MKPSLLHRFLIFVAVLIACWAVVIGTFLAVVLHGIFGILPAGVILAGFAVLVRHLSRPEPEDPAPATAAPAPAAPARLDPPKTVVDERFWAMAAQAAAEWPFVNSPQTSPTDSDRKEASE